MTPSSPTDRTSGSPGHVQYDESLRQGILTEAVRRLRNAAPDDLGLRPLAASQGTSTTAIYTMFGGKAGLLAQVAVEADVELAAVLTEALGHNSLVGDIRSLCRAYRRWALDNRGLYGLVIDEGVFRAADVHAAATAIWASLHGVVSLESSVWRESASAEQYFETQLAAILRSWTAGAPRPAAPSDVSTPTAG